MTSMTSYCDDCGQSYTCTPREHLQVCEAHLCEQCLNWQPNVIEPLVYGLRLCYECRREDDVELLYGGTEDGDESEDSNGVTEA